MPVRLHAMMTVAVTAALVAGCSMMPFGHRREARQAPPLLAAIPEGTVTGAPLPPPDGATAALPTQPPQPGASGLAALDPSLQTASVPPPAATANGAIGRTDLLGGWTISAGGASCQLFMTLTTWAGGYRASTRGCTNAPLQTISAWSMDGNQVQLLNDSGTTVARLYPASKTQFSGQTDDGGPITVSR